MKFRMDPSDAAGETVDDTMTNAAVHPSCREYVYLEFFHLTDASSTRNKDITVK